MTVTLVLGQVVGLGTIQLDLRAHCAANQIGGRGVVDFIQWDSNAGDSKRRELPVSCSGLHMSTVSYAHTSICMYHM